MARTVLIVKLAAIGDVAMALPMVTALRAADASTRIVWMCGKEVAPLIACVEGIDQSIVVDEAAILTGSRIAKTGAVAAAWTRLAGQAFDTIYVAHSDARYLMLVKAARTGSLRFLGETSRRPALVPGRAHGDEYLRLVSDLDDHRATRFAPPPISASLPDTLSARIDALGGQPLIALAPGGAKNAARDSPLRRWPIDRYAALARRLVDQGAAVAITGAATDDWVRSGFRGIPVLDLIGATDLPALVALFRRCAAVVTHDSGPMHLARLAQSPLVALFGPTLPSAFVREDATTRTLWPAVALPCAPCYDGREFADCDNNRCMQMITVDDVLAQLAQLLARRT